MTDNPHYDLQRAVDRAQAAADVSTDPAVHLVKNAMAGVVSAERERIAREARERANGIPDPDSFPRWADVCPAGESESYGPPTFIDTSALAPEIGSGE
jgi:hypothetical protein